jgi:hypothetical protein
MNNTWILLSEDNASSMYRVPEELISNKRNIFLGSRQEHERKRYDGDERWPFIALITDPAQPHLITLHIRTLPSDALYGRFGALDYPIGQYLSLTGRELSDLIAVLLNYAAAMTTSRPQTSKIFHAISPLELNTFRINPKLLPTTKQFYYLQTIDPVTNRENSSFLTILKFSVDVPNLSKSLFFSIGRLEQSRLGDENIRFFDISKALITLDKQGMLDLCSLMKEHLKDI